MKMINIKWLRSTECEDRNNITKYVEIRKIENYDEIISLDKEYRKIQFTFEKLLSDKKKESKNFHIEKQGEKKDIIQKTIESLSNEIDTLQAKITKLKSTLHDLLSGLPNVLQSEVPKGDTELDNKIIKIWGEKPHFDFVIKTHDNLTSKIDLVSGITLSGAKFCVLRDELAELERGLMNFMINEHKNFGFKEVSVPFIVSAESMFASGQLPKFEDDLFKIEGANSYLIPTGEVPLINLFKNKKISDENPERIVTQTPCFRKEAGSAGKANKGLTRLHQFTKVEIASVIHPDESEKEHQFLLSCAENILQKLNLHYRVVLLCSGDTGDTSTKTYDLEVWLPGENEYREISSCSNCHDFQSRRANIKTTSKVYAHTLNSSGLAVGRTIIAILENYQNDKGEIIIPQALLPYMNCEKFIV